MSGSQDEALANIRRSDNNDLLVSSLDPDAPARQRRTLEKADAYSERSMWMTCWEMLRRGKSWAQVCEWCLERHQSWRAISMGLASAAYADAAVGGPSAGLVWRRMCYAAAKSGSVDEYEAAVYGVLSGDLDTVEKVCRTWDDHIYAHYNSLLLSDFDQYVLRNYPQKLSPAFANRHTLAGIGPDADAGSAARLLLQRLAQNPALLAEAKSPMKLLQGSLIGNNFEALCTKVSTAIKDAANWSSTTAIGDSNRSNGAAKLGLNAITEATIAKDYDALRIMTHMVIMIEGLETPLARMSSTHTLDTIIAAYVQFLRATGKRDLAPLYASKMDEARGAASLAQVLSDIDDPKESMEFIRLMELYGIDAVAVLTGQYQHLIKNVFSEKPSKSSTLRILEPTKDELYPGQRIKLGFLPQELTAEEHALVRGLEVFHLIEGQWAVTFEALSHACRKLLGKTKILGTSMSCHHMY